MDTPRPRALSDRRRRARAAALACALVCGLLAMPAAAQTSADQVAKAIAAEFGVQVLRVRPGTIGNMPVWLVTVMTPGGNLNGAFQVNTLAVDQRSGALVPAYRQGPNGAIGTAEAPTLQSDQRPDAARSGTWR